MKRPVLALLACLLFASISFAQQTDASAPASKADIDRYLDAVHTRDMAKSMMDVITVQMQKMIHEQMLKQPNLPPGSEERLNKLIGNMYKDMPIDEMLDAMIPVYQKHFTKGDVDALIAFYSTPTGEKMLKEMPAIMSESMQAASGVMQDMMAKMTQRVNDDISQMQKSDDAKPNQQSPVTPN
jgi:uncharacterized protein